VGFRQRRLGVWLRLGWGLGQNPTNLILAPGSALDFYEELPQAYGGGKPLTVRLYVDGEQVQAELLEVNADPDQNAPVRTVPLNLVFGTSQEYVVVPIADEDERAWALNAGAVYAVVGE
jgi:hypothetical protein